MLPTSEAERLLFLDDTVALVLVWPVRHDKGAKARSVQDRAAVTMLILLAGAARAWIIAPNLGRLAPDGS